jgi:hypothetical protein
MIGTTARILFGLIVGAMALVAVTIALCTDLFAPETRPALRRASPKSKRPAIRSLMEAGT